MYNIMLININFHRPFQSYKNCLSLELYLIFWSLSPNFNADQHHSSKIMGTIVLHKLQFSKKKRCEDL